MDEVSVTIGNAMYTMAKLETVRYIRERGRQSLVTCSTGKRIATMAGLHITPIGVSRPCQVSSRAGAPGPMSCDVLLSFTLWLVEGLGCAGACNEGSDVFLISQVQSARSTLSQGVQRRPNGKSARNLVMQAAVRQRLGNRAGRVRRTSIFVDEDCKIATQKRANRNGE